MHTRIEGARIDVGSRVPIFVQRVDDRGVDRRRSGQTLDEAHLIDGDAKDRKYGKQGQVPRRSWEPAAERARQAEQKNRRSGDPDHSPGPWRDLAENDFSGQVVKPETHLDEREG